MRANNRIVAITSRNAVCPSAADNGVGAGSAGESVATGSSGKGGGTVSYNIKALGLVAEVNSQSGGGDGNILDVNNLIIAGIVEICTDLQPIGRCMGSAIEQGVALSTNNRVVATTRRNAVRASPTIQMIPCISGDQGIVAITT